MKSIKVAIIVLCIVAAIYLWLNRFPTYNPPVRDGIIIHYFYMERCPFCIKFMDTWEEYKRTPVPSNVRMQVYKTEHDRFNKADPTTLEYVYKRRDIKTYPHIRFVHVKEGKIIKEGVFEGHRSIETLDQMLVKFANY